MPHCPDCPMTEGERCHGDFSPAVCRLAKRGHGATVRKGNEAAYQGMHREDPPPTAPTSRQLAQVETCPDRSSSCGCMNKPALCARDRPARIVVLADCLACRAEAGGE